MKKKTEFEKKTIQKYQTVNERFYYIQKIKIFNSSNEFNNIKEIESTI